MIDAQIWILETPEMCMDYACKGGKIILITDDQDLRLKYIQNKLNATILLPPYPILSAELDGNVDYAREMYMQYLMTPEPDDYVTLMMAAMIQGIPLGLYFGPELNELKFPTFFLDYLRMRFGVVVGWRNQMPICDEMYLPMILEILLAKGIIDHQRFLCTMPAGLEIPNLALQILIQTLNPARSMLPAENDYNGYFKNLVYEIKQAGRYLWDPFTEPRRGVNYDNLLPVGT